MMERFLGNQIVCKAMLSLLYLGGLLGLRCGHRAEGIMQDE